MRRTKLGETQLELSLVGMGCWSIGGQYWGDDVRDEDSKSAVRAALDVGINWFDTAPLYGNGHADRVLIEALGGQRNQVVIATKVGARTEGLEHARSELSAAFIRADTEASLARLGLDHIDLLQVHWPCELGTPLEETVEALNQLVTEGKVRYWGVCNYGASDLERLVELGGLASLQTPYSMIRREFAHGLSQVCERSGIGVLAYETLARGLLTGKFAGRPRFPDSDLRSHDPRYAEPMWSRSRNLVAAVRLVADKLGTNAASIAVAYALRHPQIDVAIAGAKRPQQIIETARAVEYFENNRVFTALSPYIEATRL